MAKEGQPNNFLIFRPRKKDLNLEMRIPQSDEIQKIIDHAGLDDMGYDGKWRQYRIRLSKDDLKTKEDVVTELMKRSYENNR